VEGKGAPKIFFFAKKNKKKRSTLHTGGNDFDLFDMNRKEVLERGGVTI